MDTLAEIQERHDAVRDLEKKLLDLQQVCWFSLFSYTRWKSFELKFDAIYYSLYGNSL